jgi:hypothetical protein
MPKGTSSRTHTRSDGFFVRTGSTTGDFARFVVLRFVEVLVRDVVVFARVGVDLVGVALVGAEALREAVLGFGLGVALTGAADFSDALRVVVGEEVRLVAVARFTPWALSISVFFVRVDDFLRTAMLTVPSGGRLCWSHLIAA